MKKSLILGTLILQSISIFCQTNKTFFLGHSLVNFHMPNMVNKLSLAAAQPFTYNVNVGNGANLLYHWSNPASGQGDSWLTTLPNGGFENFILTEAVPLAGHLQWSSTYRIADSLYRFANLHNPNIKYYIYETWHCTNSGNGSTSGQQGYPCDWDPGSVMPWRQRLTTDLTKWESIADSVNAIHPNQMLVIPAGQALGRLSDSILAGNVSGVAAMTDLFGDNIHLDLRGNYFIACVMYAVIHGASPEGLPNQLTDEWGTPYALFPTPQQAAIMQRIAWQTVCAYSRDGVNCAAGNLNLKENDDAEITIFPNPSQNKVTIKSDSGINSISVYDAVGKLLNNLKVAENQMEIDFTNYGKGVYFIQIASENQMYSRKIIIE